MAERIRLAELLGGLSMIADLGFGLPPGMAVRTSVVAAALARALRLDDDEVRDTFYTALLMHLGCVAVAHESAAAFGDDIALNRAVSRSNLADPGDIRATLVPGCAAGSPWLQRPRRTALAAIRCASALHSSLSGSDGAPAHTASSRHCTDAGDTDCGWPQCRLAPPSGMIDVVRRTVLIVDDHEAFRHAARSLLETEGFDVVGEAPDGHAALAAAERLRPDVVLLDIQLPDLDGFMVADRLSTTGATADVVLISSREAATYGARLTSASARGFLNKRDLSGAALARLLA